MTLRVKIRLLGILILVIGFTVVRFGKRTGEKIHVPEIEAVPQLEPEYTVNLEEESIQ